MKKYCVLALLPIVLFAQADPDSIGGTTYDWQANGPSWRMIVNDTTLGVHALWMFSASGDPWPDRNMRYNFYDNASGQWTFNQGTTFMDFGINGYSFRTGYGSMDVNPVTQSAYFTAHTTASGTMTSTCAKDAAPGSGTFEECNGAPQAANYQWPTMSMDANERVHVALMDAASQNQLYYTRLDAWCTWYDPMHIADLDPNFQDQFINASKRSEKVALSWVNTDAVPYVLMYRESNDHGMNWDAQITLDPPPAFTPGSDTTASYHLSGNSLYWDLNDELHITAVLMPVVGGQGYIIPSEIWDYSPNRTPPWVKIHRGVCKDSNLMAGVGYNVLYVGRPQLGQDARGNFYCAWEQFDSMNVENTTSVLRANIFAAGSADGGITWSPAVRITELDETSHRFPSLAEVVDENLHIIYEQDIMAGFNVQGEGDLTSNPMVYMRVPASFVLPGAVEERGHRTTYVPALALSPNPFNRATTISYELPRGSHAALRVYDVSGNLVRTLVNGTLPAGNGTATWNGNDDAGRAVARGIYVARLETPGRTVSQKVVFSR